MRISVALNGFQASYTMKIEDKQSVLKSGRRFLSCLEINFNFLLSKKKQIRYINDLIRDLLRMASVQLKCEDVQINIREIMSDLFVSLPATYS